MDQRDFPGTLEVLAFGENGEMRLMGKRIVAGICLAALAACSAKVTDLRGPETAPGGAQSGGVPGAAAPGYSYSGEKYGRVTVQWSDELSADQDKADRLKQLYLHKAIVNHLLKHQLYDRTDDHSIAVMIDGFRFRSTANAILWGVMAGTDDLSGTVTLKDKDGAVLASFRVDTDYGLGGFGGGPADKRSGWLAGKFSELIATTILKPETVQQPAPAPAVDAGKDPP